MRRTNIDRLAELTKELLSSQSAPKEKTKAKAKVEAEAVVEEPAKDLDVNEDGKVDEADVELVQKEVRKKKVVKNEE